MKNDPGLYTDSTGEGMAGATDVSLETIYNGSRACKACGMRMNPVESLKDQDVCPNCNRRKAHNLVKGRMA
jgi:hypothetical protein